MTATVPRLAPYSVRWWLEHGGGGGGTVVAAKNPWEFWVEDYGAVGDGHQVNDVNIASGSHTLTTTTSKPFTSADVGKHIIVNGAGPGGGNNVNPSGSLITTIATFVSSSSVTLTAASSATVTNQDALFGTDDTAAIQAAMKALGESASFLGSARYAELRFRPVVYVLATSSTPGGDSTSLTYGNAQIPLPVPDRSGTDTKSTVVIKGGLDNSVLDYWHQANPQVTGTCLFSMVEVLAYDGTYGPPSVIGGPTVGTGFTYTFLNLLVVIDGIQIVCPYNPGQIAIDLDRVCQFSIGTASIDVFAAVTGSPALDTLPSNARGMGLRIPSTGLNDRDDIDEISIEGYYYGMTIDQHLTVRRMAIIYTNTALYTFAVGGNQLSHACTIQYASIEICHYCLYVDGTPGGSLFGIHALIDNESTVTEHIHDPGNYLVGEITLLPTGSSVNYITPTINGAGNVRIQSMAQPRGAVTAPAVPSSTVALQNPFWLDASVAISGGTVTAVAINGVATGLTSGMFVVPSGATIAVTYSSAPTWVWNVS